VLRAMPIARQRFARHIPALGKDRVSIVRQQRGKQLLSKIQVVFRGVRAK
jgi:hypothetical protein